MLIPDGAKLNCMKGQLLIGIIAGFFAGLIGGLLGVGGGIILIPAMVLLFSLAQHKAQGTSLFVIIPVAIAGSAVNLYYGNADLPLGALLISGSIVGAYIGAKMVMRIPERNLRKGFGVFIIIVGIKMIFG